MSNAPDPATFEIFASTAPGLEPVLAEEARTLGFDGVDSVPGGVTFRGDWPEIWRANLMLRGASRVLVRLWSFRALHLAQLDKRAHKLAWSDVLRADTPVRIDATCRKSRIYHAGAAAQRVARAIADTVGAPREEGAAVRIMVRIEDDLCTISLDTSGEPLHKRGFKQAMAKAPMRETLASLFLAQCDLTPQTPVIDPMCGSGTFIIEAAEQAMGLAPGRGRTFAFEALASFDADAWAGMRSALPPPQAPGLRFLGFDRDRGAVEASLANAQRAGVDASTAFHRAPISDLQPPVELGSETGLIIINPPYGTRIGERDRLYALYATLGRVLRERFTGWRLAMVTSDDGLAKATGLRFSDTGPAIPHGPLKIRLYRTGVL